MDRVALIYRVLSGEAQAWEREELNEWMTRSEANRREFEDIRLLWEFSREVEDQTGGDEFKTIQRRVRRRSTGSMMAGGVVLIAAIVTGVIAFRGTAQIPELMYFQRASLHEVAQAMERAYGIEIDIDSDTNATLAYTATLFRVKDKRIALRSIEHSLNVRFVEDGKHRYTVVGSARRR